MRLKSKLGLALLTISATAVGGILPAARRPSASDKIASWKGDARLAKLSGALLRALDANRSKADPGLRFSLEQAEELEVEIRMNRLDDAALRDIEAQGWEVRRAYPEYSRVIARGRRGFLEGLAKVESVAAVDLNRPPLVFGAGFSGAAATGRCVSQADEWMRVVNVRDQFGISGAGVKIGVISDSFRSRLAGTVQDGIFRPSLLDGELPDSIVLLDNGPLGGSDEGRALAELIHDLAPDAEIYFHSGSASMVDFAAAISALVEKKVNIIVDDLLFPGEAMFQDGLPARAAQRAVDLGISYFSAAGNLWTLGADEKYKDSFAGEDSMFPASGLDFHSFNGSPFTRLRIPKGCGVQVVLQWNEPLSEPGPGASSDLDLYLCGSPDPRDCSFASAGAQGCGAGRPDGFGDPIEILGPFVNTSRSTVEMYLAVDRFCGGKNPQFRLSLQELGCSLDGELLLEWDEQVFNGPQIYGHAAAEGVIAVAAVDYREVAMNGALAGDPGEIDVQPFSSQGGDLEFFFDKDGLPYAASCGLSREAGAASVRSKPDLAALDRTDTSFFSVLEEDVDETGCPNFAGTSAAAAHAAAVAALIKQRRPAFTPDDIRGVLTESPCAVPSLAGGPERGGAGLIDAMNALGVACGGGCGLDPPECGQSLPAPSDLQSIQPRWGAPVLSWLPVEGAESYQVQWQGSECGMRTEATAEPALTLQGLPPGTYRWRVRAMDPSGGEWSEWRELEIVTRPWALRR